MKRTPFILFCLSMALLAGYGIFRKTHSFERQRYEEFLKKYYAKAPKISDKKESPDQPDVAAYQDFLMTLDPALGRVPTERLVMAYQQTKAIMENNKYKSGFSSPVWQNVPTNIGGRSRAIMWDPNNPAGNKVWAGGATGGLWYNNDITNVSSTWFPVNDFWAGLSISCITADPNHPQTFYVGTGEVQTAIITYRESSGRGVGIYKTTDGGTTWQLLPSTENFAYITNIKVRNENGSSVIYAGVASGKYMGQNQLRLPSDGLYRSTDGGQFWEQVLPNITGLDIPYAPSDIALGADGRIYVGTGRNIDGQGGATILYSDLGTAGSWTKYDNYVNIIANSQYPLAGRVILATSPSDATVVYALIASGGIDTENGFNFFYCNYILKSSNKGVSWTAKNLPTDYQAGNNFAYIAWHAMDAAVDPNNPNNVYIGGLDIHKSTNSGNSWTRVSDWSQMTGQTGTDYVHADQHIMVYKPGSSSKMLFGSDGGIFYTANATATQPIFEQKNNNYNTLQCYTCAIHPSINQAKYLSGLQDNGTVYFTGTPITNNDMIDGADGAYCFYDKNQPNYFITSYYYNAYTFYNNGNYVSTGYFNSGIFINPSDYDSYNNKLYANAVNFLGSRAHQLLRVTNIPNNPSGSYITLNNTPAVIFSHIKVSPFSPTNKTTLFVGTQSGRLYKITEAQATPILKDIGSRGFPTANISCIAVGGSEDTLLATFSNYGVSSVWQSCNGGGTWQPKEGNLPDMPIRWAIYHPQNSGQVMLATELGIWTTDDINADPVVWQPAVEGMANVRVDMLQIRPADNMILAATHGRGMYTAVWLSSKSNPMTGITQEYNPMSVFPNPASDHLMINIPVQKSATVQIFNLSGSLVLENHFASGASKQLDVSTLPRGIYLLGILQGDKKVYRKIILN